MKEFERPERSIPKGKKFCPHCGDVKREKSFPDGGEYCSDCCKQMLHTHFRWYGVLVAVLSLLIAAASAAAMIIVTVPMISSMVSGNRFASQMRLDDAQNSYLEIQSVSDDLSGKIAKRFEPLGKFNWFGIGDKTWQKYIDAYAKANSFYAAGETIKTWSDRTLSPQQKRLFSEYLEKYEQYTAVSDKVSEIAREYSLENPDDVPFDEIVAKLDAFVTDDMSDYERFYIEYNKATLALYVYGENSEKTLALFEAADKFDSNEEYSDYMSVLLATSEKTGNYDKVIKKSDSLIAANKNNINAYYWKASAYMKQGDFDSALLACESMNEFNKDNPMYFTTKMNIALRRNDIELAQAVGNEGNDVIGEPAADVFSKLLAQDTGSISIAERDLFIQSVDLTILRTIVLLIQERYDEAYDLVYNYGYYYAYYYSYVSSDSSLMTQQLIDIVAISAYFANETEALSSLSEVGEYSDDAQQIMDGKLSLADAFASGKENIL